MYIPAQTLDDLLAKVFQRLLTQGRPIRPTKGPALEIAGVLLRLGSPRARLSRTESRGILFSCLGELLWYLRGTNRLDVIRYYLSGYGKFSDDKKTIWGGYGPRIFGEQEGAQIFRVIELLREKPDSRQAVVQIFDRTDLLKPHKDIPCTCTLQFMIRGKRLNMLVSMRSNDAYLGLPHDIFAFTMIQELVARSIGVALGSYKHFVGSLHLYVDDQQKATTYLEEGWQARMPMSPMPKGDPWESVQSLLKVEEALRKGRRPKESVIEEMDPYWADLARLLQVFALTRKPGNAKDIRRVWSRLSSGVYALYIRKWIRQRTPQDQLQIFSNVAN